MGRYAGLLKGTRLAKEDNLRTAQDARNAEAYTRSAEEYNYNKGRRGLLAEQDNLNLEYMKNRNNALAQTNNIRSAQDARFAEADARSVEEYNYNKGRRGLLAEQDNLSLERQKKQIAALDQQNSWQTQERKRKEEEYALGKQNEQDKHEASILGEGFADLLPKIASGEATPEDVTNFNSTGNIKIAGGAVKRDANNNYLGVELTHADGSKKIFSPRMIEHVVGLRARRKQAAEAARIAREDRSFKDPMQKEYNESAALVGMRELGVDTDSLLVDAKDKDGNAIKAYAPGADRIIGAVVSSVKSGADPEMQ